MTIKVFTVTLFVSLIVFMTSCSSTGKEYWMDNPTANEITVKIDNSLYIIPAKSGMNVFLTLGKHKLTYNNESLNFFVRKCTQKTPPVLINPTQSNYVNNFHLFIDKNDQRATDDYIEWIYRASSDSILLEINGEKVKEFLPFRVFNDVFIDRAEQRWDYFIDENIPDNVRLSSPMITRHNRGLANDPNYQAGQFQTTKHKLYREQDFLAYLKSFKEEDIKFCLEKKAYSDYTPVKIKLTTIEAINDPEYRNYMTDLQNKTNEWLQMTDPKKVIDVQEELIGVQASIKRNTMSTEYLEKHKGDHNDNLQKLDYSFNQAIREYGEQTCMKTSRGCMNISVISILIVE